MLNAADGSVIAKLQLPPGCCLQGMLYDAANHRLFILETPAAGASAKQAVPVTPLLVSYDLATGRETGRLRLDGVQAGSATMTGQASNDPVLEMWTPGFALSPDGSQIAILDGESDKLLLVDARQMTVARTMELARPQSFLERLASTLLVTLGLIPATASAKEWIGVDLSMWYSPDGHHFYVTGRKGEIGSDGKWTESGLGLRLVDVSSGQIVAEAFSNRWVTQVMPGPDGSAVLAEAEDPMDADPVTLDRLDPTTLAVTAERHFFDPPELYILTRQAPPAPTWQESWPMAGHDPQRTGRTSVIGPTEPHPLLQRKHLSPVLVGPDGTIYALSSNGLMALDSQGRTRWTVWDCCGEGPPILAPNGMLLATGFHTRTRPAHQGDTEAIGIEPDDRVAWRIQPFGLLKGAAPLVTGSNRLYLPIVGPGGDDAQGLDVMSSDGKVLRKLPLLFNPALAPDGTIYGLGSSLEAVSPGGKMLWRHGLNTSMYGVAGPLVGQGGVIYLGQGNEVDAFSPSGELLWRIPIGPWRGTSADERPSLIVDGDDTAYVGSGDGVVRAISAAGQWLASFEAAVATAISHPTSCWVPTAA